MKLVDTKEGGEDDGGMYYYHGIIIMDCAQKLDTSPSGTASSSITQGGENTSIFW